MERIALMMLGGSELMSETAQGYLGVSANCVGGQGNQSCGGDFAKIKQITRRKLATAESSGHSGDSTFRRQREFVRLRADVTSISWSPCWFTEQKFFSW